MNFPIPLPRSRADRPPESRAAEGGLLHHVIGWGEAGVRFCAWEEGRGGDHRPANVYGYFHGLFYDLGANLAVEQCQCTT